jgi:subtilase family serine protease
VSGFQPPHSFCDRTPEGLRITVKNQGRDVPRQVNVTVAFARGGNVPASVGTIQPGTPASTTVQIPAACWHPDCSFEIRVDPANLIGETNETNNNAAGYCIG